MGFGYRSYFLIGPASGALPRIGSPVVENETAKRAPPIQASATREGEVLRPNNQSKHTLFVLQSAIS